MRNAAIDKCRAAIMDLMGQQAGKEWFRAISEQSRLDYKVEYLTQCFSGPRDLSLLNSTTAKSVAQSPSAKSTQVCHDVYAKTRLLLPHCTNMPLLVFLSLVCDCVCMYYFVDVAARLLVPFQGGGRSVGNQNKLPIELRPLGAPLTSRATPWARK